MSLLSSKTITFCKLLFICSILHRCYVRLDETMCKVCWCKCDEQGFSVLISCTDKEAEQCTETMNKNLLLGDPGAWDYFGM